MSARARLSIALGVTAAGIAAVTWGLYFAGGGATDTRPAALAPARAATPGAASATATATPDVVPDIHVVVSGERMVDIAHRLCGDWSVWRDFTRVERMSDGSMVESPVTEDIYAGEWLRPPPGCQPAAGEAPEPGSTGQAARADRTGAAPSPSPPDGHNAQPAAQQAREPADPGTRVPGWEIFLRIAASRAGPSLGLAVGISTIMLIFVRFRWVDIRFRWDEAAAARRRRAAARHEATSGPPAAHDAVEVTLEQGSGGAQATPTVDPGLPGSAYDRVGVPAPIGPEATLEPRPADPQPSDPDPLDTQAVESSPAEPSPADLPPGDSRPAEPQPVDSDRLHPHAADSSPAESEAPDLRPEESRAAEPRPPSPQPAESPRAEPEPVQPQPVEPKSIEPAPGGTDSGEPASIPDYTRDPVLGDPIFGVPARHPPKDEPTS